MSTTINTGVTTTVTTLARVAKDAEAKGSTIPDLLLHEYLIAMRAEAKAKTAKEALANAMREYMTSEAVTALESVEAKAITYPVKNRGEFDKDGLERDHPAVFARYYTPGDGTHEAFKVTPKA